MDRRNIWMLMEYSGTAYAGFQRQPHKPTIQEELEKALSTILGEDIKVRGSGRTDAGVHALEQSANFLTGSRKSLKDLQRSLNAVLPKDIVIISLEETDLDFDARRDAKYREYQYRILNRSHPSAFLLEHAYWIKKPLDVKAMDQAARYLEGRHDFSAFCAAISRSKGCVRKVLKAKVVKKDDLVTIDVRADAFVHHMVRNIAGTLIKVGLREWPPEKLKEILEGKDRTKAGPIAPAKGLFLKKVKY